MAHLNFHSPSGPFWQYALDKYRYSQAVTFPNPDGSVTIKLSGQTGHDVESGTLPKEYSVELDNIFKNMATVLQNVHPKAGLEHVYLLRTYNTELAHGKNEEMVAAFARWFPNHKPLWTHLGAISLGEKEMSAEIEVEAHVPA